MMTRRTIEARAGEPEKQTERCKPTSAGSVQIDVVVHMAGHTCIPGVHATGAAHILSLSEAWVRALYIRIVVLVHQAGQIRVVTPCGHALPLTSFDAS